MDVRPGETIELLTRYAGAENRLTAMLGALLNVSEVDSRRLAIAWAGERASSGPITVTPQCPVGGSRGVPVGWVDLELKLGAEPNAVVIWVEAKLGSGLSGSNQLEKYQAGLRARRRHAQRLVLLLAPAHTRQRFGLPPFSARVRDSDGPYFVSWQDVYRELDHGRARERASVHWLRREVLAHMKSEGLDAPKRFTRADAKALARADCARAALDAVLAAASDKLSHTDGWGPPQAANTVEYWEYEHRAYPVRGRRTGWRQHTKFAWGSDKRIIYAGVYYDHPSGPPTKGDNASWLAQLQARGAQIDDDWLGYEMPLGDVVDQATVDLQARHVADWVLKTFRTIYDSRP